MENPDHNDGYPNKRARTDDGPKITFMACYLCQLMWKQDEVEPFMIPCGHSFCKKCIDEEIGKILENGPNEKNEIYCPECNKLLIV